jgi:3-oxoacyl-[acyl-carrier-protein] synthase III
MRTQLDNIKITGLCGVVPTNISKYDDELGNYSHSVESSVKLKKVMGYNEHRVVKGEATISDMVFQAFQQLESKGLIDVMDIDAIIVVTQTPDHHIPSTSSILHGLLGAKESCYCLDINDGCTGYLRGLFESSSLIRNSDSKKVLLITGDILSRKVSKNDRNSYPLVGDAVTLTLVEYQNVPNESPFELRSNGKGAFALTIPAGGMALPSSSLTSTLNEDEEGNIRALDHLVMKGREVFTFTQTTVITFIDEFLKEHSTITPDSYFLHQANLFILERISRKLKVDSKQLPTDVIRKYGNSSSATIPMAMVEKYRMLDFKKISEFALLAGFGVGLTWGAAILKLDSLQFCNLIEIEV